MHHHLHSFVGFLPPRQRAQYLCLNLVCLHSCMVSTMTGREGRENSRKEQGWEAQWEQQAGALWLWLPL